MPSSTITVVIDGRPYQLSATDADSLAKLSSEDRQQLITLLQAVQQTPLVPPAMASDEHKLVDINELPSLTGQVTPEPSQPTSISQEPDRSRMSGVEVDAMFAKLVAEERQNHQPLTLQGLMKFIAIVTAIILILVYVF